MSHHLDFAALQKNLYTLLDDNQTPLPSEVVLLPMRSPNFTGSVDSTTSNTPEPIFDDATFFQEFYNELKKETEPPADYLCHRCYHKGHLIQFCPTKNPENEWTQYQGSKLSCAEYHCCGRTFTLNIVANQVVECHRCKNYLKPKRMRKL